MRKFISTYGLGFSTYEQSVTLPISLPRLEASLYQEKNETPSFLMLQFCQSSKNGSMSLPKVQIGSNSLPKVQSGI